MLKISREDMERIFRHAAECFPAECCGILAGRKLEAEYVVERVYPARNVLESSFEYRVDPEEQVKIFEEAEAQGLDVVGFYHSHPIGEAYWSSLDEKRSKLWPGYMFLIVSPKRGSFHAYLRRENETVEVQVKFSSWK
ncbi:MAG: M67 family metallopeptidase [Candidatus Bathyarchaeia archaeon]